MKTSFCLALAMLGACATVPAQPRLLAGSAWSVVKVNGQPAGGSIEFRADDFVAEFGCNRVLGRYRVQGTTMAAEAIIKSQMACEPLEPSARPSPMDIEEAALAVLGDRPQTYWDGVSGLELRAAKGTITLEAAR